MAQEAARGKALGAISKVEVVVKAGPWIHAPTVCTPTCNVSARRPNGCEHVLQEDLTNVTCILRTIVQESDVAFAGYVEDFISPGRSE